MTIYDGIMLGLVVAGMAWGAWKGITWQAASLASLFLGYLVAFPSAGLAVGLALDEPGVDERGEPPGQDGAGDAEVGGEVVETTEAVEQVAQQHEGPGVADDRGRARDGAVGRVEVGPCGRSVHRPRHRHSLAGLLIDTQPF